MNRASVCFALTLLLVSGCAEAVAHDTVETRAEPTTVILVRHAEKDLSDPSDRDPELTEEGVERAWELVHLLGHSGLDAVYSTPLRRTRGTARPVAEALGLDIRDAPIEDHAAAMARILRRDHAGDVVLVVGHSNTTPDLARALGADGAPDMPEWDYDELWILTVADDRPTTFLPLSYGEGTP